MIAAYPDLNGYVGQPDPQPDPAEAASDACRSACEAAGDLAEFLDRREGDAGEHADALKSITERIVALHDEAFALLGGKCLVVRDRHGMVLGVVRGGVL